MSKKTKMIPTAIYLRNVGSVEVTDNSFLGDARVIDANVVGSVSFKSNTYMSTEAYRIFKELNQVLLSFKNDLPGEILSELIVKVKMMEIEQGKPSFLKTYSSLIASISNHATILAPVMPMIQPLIESLLHLGRN